MASPLHTFLRDFNTAYPFAHTEERAKKYYKAAEKMLQTLSSPAYTAEEGTNGGFILKHSVGNIPSGTEVDMPLTYADYYYVEALCRYKSLNDKP